MQLTIGMATHDDYHGVWFTVQSLRAHHPAAAAAEIIVVDNHPNSAHGKAVEKLATAWKACRYIPAPELTGTAAPRDRVFQEATGDIVLCLDCHVLLLPGSLEALLQFYADPAHARDMAQGPMVYDDLRGQATHFKPEWGDGMWGRWAEDERGRDPNAEPFEIPMMGLGAFACRREAWPGFNRAFRGFGGEEGYIHEKIRQAGGRCWCLPGFRWVHRFGRPDGVPYRLALEDKLRNYLIGDLELGRPIESTLQHFVPKMPAETVGKILAEVLASVPALKEAS